MANAALYPGEWTQLENKYACYHKAETGRCKLSKDICKMAVNERPHECGTYIHPTEAVRRASIPKKFRELIAEANGRMLFVEHGDPRFTEADLNEMIDFMVHRHEALMRYVHVDKDPDGDMAMITIFEGIGRILVD